MRLTTTLRLCLVFSVILLFFLMGILFAIKEQNRLADANTKLAEVNIPLALTAAHMQRYAVQVQQWLTDVSVTHDEEGNKDALEAFTSFNESLATFRAAFTKTGNTQGLSKLAGLQKDIENLNATGQRMAKAYITEGREAGNVIMEDFDAAAQRLTDSLVPFIEEQQNEAKQTSDLIQKEMDLLNTIQWLVFAGATITGCVCTFLLARNLNMQLGAEPADLAQAAATIAKGQFELGHTFTNVPVNSVLASMLHMRDTLRRNFEEHKRQTEEVTQQNLAAKQAEEQVRVALAEAQKAKQQGILEATQALEGIIESLANASKELENHLTTLVRGAHDQAERVSSSSASMQEMQSTVQEIAHNASNAAQVADSARQSALEGAQAVKDVADHIHSAQAQAEHLKEDMGALGKQTEGISSVLTVINDIADQTNLLALNAAIEAARAGDAGRGIAVVADEVRKLAEKTVVATKEVHKALAGLTQGAQQNIAAVDNTVRTITMVTQKSVISGSALESIVDFVDQTAGQVNAIACAAEEQAAASEVIATSLHDVADITNSSLSSMDAVATAMHKLQTEVQNIHTVLNTMRSDAA